MIGPEVQKAIFDALKASPALAGGRVYDSVPANAEFPYVSIGEEQIVGDGNSCGDGWEIFADVHVWSRKPGFPEAKGIAATVVDRVTAVTSVSGFAVIEVEFQDMRALRDTDGLTSHIVCSFRFIIDPA
jgi:hypothetical protein